MYRISLFDDFALCLADDTRAFTSRDVLNNLEQTRDLRFSRR